jgi:hypothetical protein
MDALSKWINDWTAFSSAARQRLSDIHSCEIDSLDFQEAVREIWKVDRATDMLYKELPPVDEIVEMLRDYPFAALRPEFVEEVYLSEGIIPSEFPRLLTEETIKSSGERWRIHKNDVDPFPSSPHAHNLETGLKLHLGTGHLYSKRTHKGRILCKDLLLIRAKVQKIELPEFCCQ